LPRAAHRRLAIQSSVSVVIVVVLPLAKLVIKQMDVISEAILVQELIELLLVDAVCE
jgi:hypothetical protein